MKFKETSDEQLLEMIARLCHFIAFETTVKGIPSPDDKEKTDSNTIITNKEQIIQQLFALTDYAAPPKRFPALQNPLASCW